MHLQVTSGFYGAVWLTLLDPSLYGSAAAKYFPLLADVRLGLGFGFG